MSLWMILRGAQLYGLSPEEETAWCRACLLIGFVVGLVVCIGLGG